jgi:hypothetical protein
MKKLLILSVLLGLMALPMFASDVTFGGDVTFGWIGDFGDNEAEAGTLTTDIKATVDDYNSLVIEMDWLDAANIPDKAVVTTDLGMWLDLPVGLTANWGWDDPDVNEFHSVSGYGNEEVFDFSKGDYWGHQFLLSAGMLEVEVAFDPGRSGGLADFGKLLAGVAVKEAIPGLNAEVYYYQGGDLAEAEGPDEVLGTGDDGVYTNTDDFDMGQIAVDAGYAGEFGDFALDAGVGFVYDMDDQAANAWAFGVGLSGAYSIATVTVGLDGNETDALAGLSATAEIAPFDMATIYAGMWYDAANSDLLEIDLGVNAHIGAAEAYLGYVVTDVASGDNYNSPAGIIDGGAYIKFDIDY